VQSDKKKIRAAYTRKFMQITYNVFIAETYKIKIDFVIEIFIKIFNLITEIKKYIVPELCLNS